MIRATITSWPAKNSYGFATVADTAERIFVHEKHIALGSRRPEMKGRELECEIEPQPEGRKRCAKSVRMVDEMPLPKAVAAALGLIEAKPRKQRRTKSERLNH